MQFYGYQQCSSVIVVSSKADVYSITLAADPLQQVSNKDRKAHSMGEVGDSTQLLIANHLNIDSRWLHIARGVYHQGAIVMQRQLQLKAFQWQCQCLEAVWCCAWCHAYIVGRWCDTAAENAHVHSPSEPRNACLIAYNAVIHCTLSAAAVPRPS